jgi:hypothetical protein
LHFDRETCQWSVLGQAADVQRTVARQAVLDVLGQAGHPLSVPEIMAGMGRTDRNAVDQLLFKMVRDEEVARGKRGQYFLPAKDASKKVRLGLSDDDD